MLHSNRIRANRNSLFWCIKHEKLSNDSTEIDNKKIQNNAQGIQNEKTSLVKLIKNSYPVKIFSKICAYLKKIYKFLITNNYGKLIVGIVFAIYISFSAFNAVKIKEGLEIPQLVSHDSYFATYFKQNMAEFSIETPVMLIINGTLDYSNKSTRKKIDQFLLKARKIDGMNNEFLISWMNIFRDELKELRKTNNSDLLLNKMANTTTPFSNDIVLGFNNELNKTEIIASRFYIKYKKSELTSRDAVIMNDIKDLCKYSELPIVAFSVAFKIFEQFEQVVPNTLQAFIIATESMYLITLIFIPDLLSAVCIILSMFSIMIGMIGCMHVWGLTLSSITMIEVIMSVGFCIDFSAHLTHAFIAGVGKGSRNDRAYKACIKTGVPIFNSALSTIIGVCVLSMSQSYVFQTFFKTIILIMVLGVFTSMLFLPVLLSLIGPHWKCHEENLKKDAENSVVDANEQLLNLS